MVYQISEEEFKVIIDKCKHAAVKTARKYSLDNGHFEDILQEAIVRSLGAAKRFDPKKGFKITTYLNPHINGAAMDYMRYLDPIPRSTRKEMKEKGHILTPTGSICLGVLDVSVDRARGVPADEEDEVCLFENVDVFCLDTREQAFLYLYLKDITLKKIGNLFDITESRASQVLTIIRDKLKKGGNNEIKKSRRSKHLLTKENQELQLLKSFQDFFKQGYSAIDKT